MYCNIYRIKLSETVYDQWILCEEDTMVEVKNELNKKRDDKSHGKYRLAKEFYEAFWDNFNVHLLSICRLKWIL